MTPSGVFVIIGYMKYLLLSKGLFAIVDDADFDYLNQWKWHVAAKGYAARDARVDGKKIKIYMHKLINGTADGYDTDHINRDKLDNRRANLRQVTRSVNMRNCLQSNNTSGYRGVSWHKQRSKWTARAKINGSYKSLGLFDTPEEASCAYQNAVASLA